MTPDQRLNTALTLSALIVIGTFGPWATIFAISISGTSTGDGKLVLVLGLAAVLVSLALRFGKLGGNTGRVLLAVIGALVAAIAVYDTSNLGGNTGWGIILDIIAGVGLVGLAIMPRRAETPDE